MKLLLKNKWLWNLGKGVYFLFVKLSNICVKSNILTHFELVPIAKYSPLGEKQEQRIGCESSITFFNDKVVIS